VKILHDNRVAHRDIKPANFVLQEAGAVMKLMDFGTAKQLMKTDMTKTNLGSPYYMDNQIHQKNKYNAFDADIWSMGVFLYHMCTGKVPYNAKSLNELREKVAKRKITYPRGINLSNCLKDLIEHIIVA
jgi:NIMA (never in mitosis gene a)-related kinase